MRVRITDQAYYDRETLYKEAWAEPMIKVAERYGVSSVALAKTCRRLKVPTPPRGYWARIEAGQKIKQPALPAYQTASKIRRPQYVIKEDETAPEVVHLLPEVFAEARRLIADETNPAMKIQVLEEYPKLHPAVIAISKILTKKSQYDFQGYGRRDTGGSGSFSISVGPGSAGRVVNILQALCLAFMSRKFEIKIEEAKNAQILIMGEAIRFSIFESSHKVPPKEPRSKYSYRDYDYEPSGILQIQIEEVPSDMDSQKTWRDSKTKKLEQVLNSVIGGMILCAAWRKEGQEYWRLQKIKADIAKKKREEEERQKALDKRRATLFGEDCQKWQQYKQLSEFFGQIKATYTSPEQLANEEFQKWVAWCEAYLKSINPLESAPPQYTVALR